MAENQYGFPTEVLSLPSQGLLYPEDSPLRSGTIDVKYMTAKEEDILTSTNLIEQGVVITKLLESVIADPKVKLDDMNLKKEETIQFTNDVSSMKKKIKKVHNPVTYYFNKKYIYYYYGLFWIILLFIVFS